MLTQSLSVVMPVYNALPYLDECMGSILNQSFKDFEFIILDDASTDGSTQLLRSWALKDSRIRLYIGQRNLGPVGSSNFTVQMARAPIIARMDADDISLPERLEKQWEVMQKRHDAALIGTLFEGIAPDGQPMRPRDRWHLARRRNLVPFPHGSVMFRRDIFDAIGGYREECAGWEDFDLVWRMKERGLILVLVDALYHYRYTADSVTGWAGKGHVAPTIPVSQHFWSGFRSRLDDGLALAEKDGDTKDLERLAHALNHADYWRLLSCKPPNILGFDHRNRAFAAPRRLLRTLLLATWGQINLKSFRFCLRMIVQGRDLLAGFYITRGMAYEWRPKQ